MLVVINVYNNFVAHVYNKNFVEHLSIQRAHGEAKASSSAALTLYGIDFIFTDILVFHTIGDLQILPEELVMQLFPQAAHRLNMLKIYLWYHMCFLSN